jgi:hypothetical protein
MEEARQQEFEDYSDSDYSGSDESNPEGLEERRRRKFREEILNEVKNVRVTR